MLRRSAVVTVAAILVCALVMPVAAAGNPFPDVPADHWAHDAVANIAAAGLVIGYPDGTFLGDQAMTRYEMAMVIDRVLKQLKEMTTELDALDAVAADKIADAKDQLARNLQANVAKAKAGLAAQLEADIHDLAERIGEVEKLGTAEPSFKLTPEAKAAIKVLVAEVVKERLAEQGAYDAKTLGEVEEQVAAGADALNNAIIRLEGRMNAIFKLLSDTRDDVAGLKETNATVSDKLAALDERLARVESPQRLEELIDAVSEQVAADVEVLTSEYEDELRVLNARVDVMAKLFIDMKDSITATGDKVAGVEESVAALEDKAAALSQGDNRLEGRINAVNYLLQKLTERVDNVQADLDGVAGVAVTTDDVTQLASRLEGRMNAINFLLTRVSEQVDELTADVSGIRESYVQSDEQLATRLEGRMNAIAKLLFDVRDRAGELENKVAEFDSRIAGLEKAYIAADDALDTRLSGRMNAIAKLLFDVRDKADEIDAALKAGLDEVKAEAKAGDEALDTRLSGRMNAIAKLLFDLQDAVDALAAKADEQAKAMAEGDEALDTRLSGRMNAIAKLLFDVRDKADEIDAALKAGLDEVKAEAKAGDEALDTRLSGRMNAIAKLLFDLRDQAADLGEQINAAEEAYKQADEALAEAFEQDYKELDTRLSGRMNAIAKLLFDVRDKADEIDAALKAGLDEVRAEAKAGDEALDTRLSGRMNAIAKLLFDARDSLDATNKRLDEEIGALSSAIDSLETRATGRMNAISKILLDTKDKADASATDVADLKKRVAELEAAKAEADRGIRWSGSLAVDLQEDYAIGGTGDDQPRLDPNVAPEDTADDDFIDPASSLNQTLTLIANATPAEGVELEAGIVATHTFGVADEKVDHEFDLKFDSQYVELTTEGILKLARFGDYTKESWTDLTLYYTEGEAAANGAYAQLSLPGDVSTTMFLDRYSAEPGVTDEPSCYTLGLKVDWDAVNMMAVPGVDKLLLSAMYLTDMNGYLAAGSSWVSGADRLAAVAFDVGMGEDTTFIGEVSVDGAGGEQMAVKTDFDSVYDTVTYGLSIMRIGADFGQKPFSERFDGANDDDYQRDYSKYAIDVSVPIADYTVGGAWSSETAGVTAGNGAKVTSKVSVESAMPVIGGTAVGSYTLTNMPNNDNVHQVEVTGTDARIAEVPLSFGGGLGYRVNGARLRAGYATASYGEFELSSDIMGKVTMTLRRNHEEFSDPDDWSVEKDKDTLTFGWGYPWVEKPVPEDEEDEVEDPQLQFGGSFEYEARQQVLTSRVNGTYRVDLLDGRFELKPGLAYESKTSGQSMVEASLGAGTTEEGRILGAEVSSELKLVAGSGGSATDWLYNGTDMILDLSLTYPIAEGVDLTGNAKWIEANIGEGDQWSATKLNGGVTVEF